MKQYNSVYKVKNDLGIYDSQNDININNIHATFHCIG